MRIVHLFAKYTHASQKENKKQFNRISMLNNNKKRQRETYRKRIICEIKKMITI